jgi:hypothetical protein
MAKTQNTAFSKEKIQMAKKHMKKFSTSLTIKEMKIKTMLRFYLTLVRMATTNVGEDMGEKGTFMHRW